MPHKHPKIRINWTWRRQQRLLDWLDTHPEERAVLFSQRNQLNNTRGSLNKTICAVRAAAAVFANDEDAEVQKEALADPAHFGIIIGEIIRRKWPEKYQLLNQKIGRVVANMQYSEIAADSALLRKVENQMQKMDFPAWGRLHVYWRMLPHYNQLCNTRINSFEGLVMVGDNPSMPSTSSSGRTPTLYPSLSETPTQNRLRPRPRNTENDLIWVTPRRPPGQKGGGISSRRGSSDYRDSADSARPSPADRRVLSATENHRRKPSDSDRHNKRTLSDFRDSSDDSGSCSDTDDDCKGLTTVQRHEFLMAKIQVKRQKLELACLEKKRALTMQQAQIDANARLQLEKHEIRMQLVAFANEGFRNEGLKIDADGGNGNATSTRRGARGTISGVFE